MADDRIVVSIAHGHVPTRYYLQCFKGRDSQWYWRIRSPNHRTVGGGEEGYSTRAHLERAVVRLKEKGALNSALPVIWPTRRLTN